MSSRAPRLLDGKNTESDGKTTHGLRGLSRLVLSTSNEAKPAWRREGLWTTSFGVVNVATLRKQLIQQTIAVGGEHAMIRHK